MENEKYTIKTDFGLGGPPEREITFYECLKDNEQAKKTRQLLNEASQSLSLLMNEIYKKHPEYYNELLPKIQAINGLRSELAKQIDGYIIY